jgi:hypothetical protein
MTARYNKELEEVLSTEEDPMEKLFIWFGKLQMLLTAQTILGLVRSFSFSSLESMHTPALKNTCSHAHTPCSEEHLLTCTHTMYQTVPVYMHTLNY